ncbi:dual specificity protein phosphatase family protein [Flavobacterium filum]|uniref:dual specificity protein phosphatase family protein n=1 Tax=Flavobacterium filum TaxID=370974 RepID=UPI0023F22C6C|nr:dual specificity protein phosphatase family protein [Flavobacterium filum]
MEVDFDLWLKNDLKIGGYPVGLLHEKERRFDMIVNVSDEYYSGHAAKWSKMGYEYFWFPLAQSSRSMGLVSIFGALHVLYRSYKENKKVLVHCRKGSNRSQVVVLAFYYMMRGKQMDEPRNMLLYNCKTNHLPPIEEMEKWLLRCKKAFDNYGAFKGNMLDWTLHEFSFQEGEDFFSNKNCHSQTVEEIATVMEKEMQFYFMRKDNTST